MDCITAIAQRYSYRGRFEKTPVPREHLQQIMEAGLAAPSGCNQQTTSLIGVDDPTLIQSLGSLLSKPGFASAPSAICVLTQRIKAYDDTTFYIQDYSAAIENMLLAVTAMGYVSCWVEGYVTGERQVGPQMAEILNVPESYEFIAYLPIGIPTEAPKHAQRKPFAERAWFNGFGK